MCGALTFSLPILTLRMVCWRRSQQTRRALMPSGQPATVACPDPERMWPSLIALVHEYALLLLDPDGRILSWNRGAELIKGYGAAEIIGRHFSCLYPPEDIAAGVPERELGIAAATGRCETIGEHVRKDGSRFLANVVITANRAPDGTLRGFGKITRDITERTAAEAVVKASETRLRSLIATVLDTVVDGLITIDRTGIIQSFNKACVRLFGYTPDEVVGQNVRILMPEPYHSEHDHYVSAYLATNVPKIIGIGREVMGRRKDGSTFPMELAVGESPQGGNHAFVGIVRDLTERREADNAARPVAPVAEDGGGRSAYRRPGARLQQPAGDHHRQSRHAARDPRRRSGDRRAGARRAGIGAARCGPDTSTAGLRAPSAATARARRHQRGHRRHRATARAHPRREHHDRNVAVTQCLAGADRSGAVRGGDRQSRHQRA